MCLAIATMLAWQLWSISIGETAVESYDHEYYRKVASSRGEVCLDNDCPTSSSDSLTDIPELLRPGVCVFIAYKTIIRPISFLQEVKESPALF